MLSFYTQYYCEIYNSVNFIVVLKPNQKIKRKIMRNEKLLLWLLSLYDYNAFEMISDKNAKVTNKEMDFLILNHNKGVKCN